MDYIVTDVSTSPPELAYAYTEKVKRLLVAKSKNMRIFVHSFQLAYMPHTFFIGDHMQMFRHLKERCVLKDRQTNTPNRDTLTIINAADLQPLLERVEVKPMIREAEVLHGPEKEIKKTEVMMPIIEVATTEPVTVSEQTSVEMRQMIQS